MLFSKALTAIDMGSRTLKGLQLANKNGEISVSKYFFHDLATDNEIFPLEASGHQILKTLVDQNQLSRSKVITALQDSEIFTHDLTLPNMPDADLKLAIYNDIETHMNLPRESTYLDYIYLEKAENHRDSKNVIKTYCAKRDSVTKLIENLAYGGLKPKYVDSEILARVAMLTFNKYVDEGKNYVTIEFGESHTSVALISNFKVLMNSVLPTGFGNLNKILFETSGLPYSDGEKVKLTYDPTAEAGDSEVDLTLIDEHFRQTFYKVRRLVEVFKVQLKSAFIHSVLITGGGSQMINLSKAVESYLDLPVETPNPFRHIKLYNDKDNRSDELARLAPHMASAVGLALRDIA